MTIREGQLVLADGSVFEGELIGAGRRRIATGEVVFNTALSGYQEIITDPSYAGQIITFTYPHIGNYGVNADDYESRGAFCRGVIVRDLARRPSNHRVESHLQVLLERHAIPGIAGIDTRRLTRLIRDTGAMPGAFGDARRGRTPGRGAGRAGHRRRRPRRPGDDRPAVHGRATVERADRRLRLRHQDHDPPAPRRPRPGRGRAGVDVGRRRARSRPGRCVPLERPRRPRDGRGTPSTTSPS